MSKEVAKYDNNGYKQLEKQVLALPSTSKEAMSEIVQGLYAGKPLFGYWRVTYPVAERSNTSSIAG